MRRTISATASLLLFLSLVAMLMPKARSTDPLPPPLVKVEPEYVARNPGELFNLSITINGLDVHWRMVAVQFRLCYNDTLLTASDAIEGSFLKNTIWAPDGTYFLTQVIAADPTYGPHVVVAIVILPNATGQWNNFPCGNGVLAKIPFEVVGNPPDKCALTLNDTMGADDDSNIIPFETQDGCFHTGRTPGDIDGSGMCDGTDISIAAHAWGAYGFDYIGLGCSAHARWDSVADVNEDNRIDGADIISITRNYGKQYS